MRTSDYRKKFCISNFLPKKNLEIKSDLTSLTQVSNSTPLTGLRGVGIKANRDISVGDAAMDKKRKLRLAQEENAWFPAPKTGKWTRKWQKKETSKSRNPENFRMSPSAGLSQRRAAHHIEGLLKKGSKRIRWRKDLPKLPKQLLPNHHFCSPIVETSPWKPGEVTKTTARKMSTKGVQKVAGISPTILGPKGYMLTTPKISVSPPPTPGLGGPLATLR